MKIQTGRMSQLILLILLFLFAFSILDNGNQTFPEPEMGKPITLTTPIDINTCKIAQIVDDGERMYILANDHLGYVQVYGLNGEYQQTILFYSDPNGAFEVAVEDQMFYVKDKRQNIYMFKKGNFDAYVPVWDDTYAVEELDFSSSSSRYELRWSSIWRIDMKEPVCVIERPFWAGFIQYNGTILLWGISILLICWIACFLKCRETATDNDLHKLS